MTIDIKLGVTWPLIGLHEWQRALQVTDVSLLHFPLLKKIFDVEQPIFYLGKVSPYITCLHLSEPSSFKASKNFILREQNNLAY